MTIADVRARNKAAGEFWFERKTMRFFNSRIESKLYKNNCFITSEKPPHSGRRYSVRRAMPDGSIDTVGEFCGFRNVEDAREAARNVPA